MAGVSVSYTAGQVAAATIVHESESAGVDIDRVRMRLAAKWLDAYPEMIPGFLASARQHIVEAQVTGSKLEWKGYE